MSDDEDNPLQILVLGMHRCGTSLTTRLVHGFGISAGDIEDLDPTKPSVENPRGFWEHVGVRDANVTLMAAAGCDWDRVLNWNNAPLPPAALENFSESAKNIASRLNTADRWVIKDPRLCLTVRFWSPFLQSPRYVWSTRAPLEAALSLRQRNDFPIDVGLALWEVYNQEIINFISEREFLVVDYARVMQSPSEQLKRLSDWLRSQLPDGELRPTNEEEILKFVDPSLYRSRIDDAAELCIQPEDHPSFSLYQKILDGRELKSLVGRRVSEVSSEILARHERVWRLNSYRIRRRHFPDVIPPQDGDVVTSTEAAAHQLAMLQARCEATNNELEMSRAYRRELSYQLDFERERQLRARRQIRVIERTLDEFRQAISALRTEAPSSPKHQLSTSAIGQPGDGHNLSAPVVSTAGQKVLELLSQIDPALTAIDQVFDRGIEDTPNFATNTQRLVSRLEQIAYEFAPNVPNVSAQDPEGTAGTGHLAYRINRALRLLSTLEQIIRKSIDNFSGHFDPYRGEIDSIKAAVAVREKELRALQKKLTQQMEEKSELQTLESRELHYLSAKLRRLEARLEDRHSRVDLMQKQLQSLRSELSALRTAYASSAALNEQLIADRQLLISAHDQQLSAFNRISALFDALLKSWRWRVGDFMVRMVEGFLFRSRQQLASDHIANILTRTSKARPQLTQLPPAMSKTGRRKRGAPIFSARELIEGGWTAAGPVVAKLYSQCYSSWELDNEAAMRDFPKVRIAWETARPSVMVGSLHCGENEFESNRRSLGRQTYPIAEHLVISDLPNREAHDRLYTGFLNSDCDILLKLDADMVIVDETFIERVVSILVARPELGLLQMAILDYYSGGEIQGVNAYTKRMNWDAEEQDAIFTDSTQTANARRFVVWGTFTRSVVHSPNPTRFQAFHFGVHRATKVLTALRAGSLERAAEQILYLERTFEHFEMRRTDDLLDASLGAEFGLRGTFSVEEVDYSNPRMSDFHNDLQSQPRIRRELLLRKMRREPLEDGSLETLRSLRGRISRRPQLKRLLLVLPHFKIFGGVNRFFEIARQAMSQGINSCVTAPVIPNRQQIRVQKDFPGVTTCTLAEAMDSSWDAVICGDFSSGLMTSLPWFDTAISAVYLLNGWQHRHINNVQIELAQPDMVMANSSYAAEQYPEWAPAVVAGGIDVSIFKPAPMERADDQPLRICMPGGRNKPRKRFEDGIKACQLLHRRGLRIELHVLDVSDCSVKAAFPVVFHRELNRRQVVEMLQSMDVMVCPEEDAGWNNPAAEAMACGIPVVCTNAGTTDFAVHEQTALVVPVRDPVAIAESVERLVPESELAQRLASRGPDAVNSFSWDKLTRNMIDLIETCRFNREARAARNRQARKNIVSLLVDEQT